MSNFDTKTMYNFEKYLTLQKSGETNMVSSDVQKVLGISREEHLFIINNYDALLEEFNNLKVVDELLEDAKERVNGDASKNKDFKSRDFEQPDIQH